MEEMCGKGELRRGRGKREKLRVKLAKQRGGSEERRKGRKRDARENMRRSKKESTHLDGVTNEAADDMTIPSCNLILLPLPSSCSL